MSDAAPEVDCFSALDLGQTHEFTALAVLERTTFAEADASGRHMRSFAGRHLERFAIGTSYAEIKKRVAPMFAEPPLTRSTLVIDVTMVGKGVLDQLR